VIDTDFHSRLERIADDIELPENFTIEIGYDGSRYCLQIGSHRKDVITGEMGWGWGGKAYPTPETSDGDIVKAIFGLYKGYVEHEARETFLWNGRRIFGPHTGIEALWEAAAHVDVPSAKHEGSVV
jgi:hypothetical protein